MNSLLITFLNEPEIIYLSQLNGFNYCNTKKSNLTIKWLYINDLWEKTSVKLFILWYVVECFILMLSSQEKHILDSQRSRLKNFLKKYTYYECFLTWEADLFAWQLTEFVGLLNLLYLVWLGFMEYQPLLVIQLSNCVYTYISDIYDLVGLFNAKSSLYIYIEYIGFG